MICIENGYRITKYFLFNALILFPLCFAQDEIENNQTLTSLGPFGNWNRMPTIEPSGISERYPYLYFSTIIFVIVIVATSFLIGLRSCYKASNYLTYQCSARAPVVREFRRSLVPTEAVMINRRVLPDDKPPSYTSVIQGQSYGETNVLLTSETPPPNYSSII
ncbi:uncharacterized protein LOC129960606 isoform X4 [Argiope bruennichi]|uniref:uncharacterized protein LOC129960606 isoform X4 n=1 Tax=Argiope bruennichi TaxID=94029 RepID=UPI00249457FD|nr:uncharacterized protein LOC129960606 isoform X4 [Argiope bruennichi]